MVNSTNLQQPGQNPEKSTVMWTRPATEEQKRYFSKHAPERQVYGWIMTLMQIGHAMLAFAAWNAVYGWALDGFGFLHMLVPVLASFTLMALHVLFRTTWETYWYDKLDNDPKTDSPIIVPILIIIGLLGCEVYGAGKFLESKVEAVNVIDAAPISEQHKGEVADLRRQFAKDSARIVGVYAPKIEAAALPYQGKINRLKATPAKDYAEAQYIKQQKKSLQAQCDQAIAPVLAARANELANASTGISARIQAAYDRHERGLTDVENKNRGEDTRYKSEMDNTGAMSWIISIFLLGLIAVLGYRRVRINVMSGILPLRQYTILDAHGSAVERIYTALSDAMNRRWLQFAVWLHRYLSPRHALTSFDGTVVTRPGDYNTPEQFHHTPTPPKTKTKEQAEAEVLEKLARNPGARLSAQQFSEEVNKAINSNGHYKDIPLPGKNKPVAVPLPAATGDAREASLRMFLNKALDLHRNGKNEELYADGPMLRECQDLGLQYGTDLEAVFCAGIRQSGQYYPVESLVRLPFITLPPAIAEDGGYLFKQENTLFKQIFGGDGRVVGLAYKGPRMTETQTVSYSQVLSRIGIYEKGDGRTDETIDRNLAIWKFALSLFAVQKEEVAS